MGSTDRLEWDLCLWVTGRDPRDELIERLATRLQEALVRIAELEAKLGQSSRNSSKPPSSDGPGAMPRTGKPTGKKRGGQPGHDPSRRDLLPPEQVDRVEDHWPTDCSDCKAPLVKERCEEPTAPQRHQVTELPVVRAHVTEHRLHSLVCGCGRTTEAVLPVGTPSGAFGSRLRGAITLMTGRYRLSKRMAQEMLSDLFGVEVGLGSICNVEKQVSASVAAPVEAAREYVRTREVVHLDETGWREEKRRAWLWVATTALVTVFQIARSRGSDVAKSMLGADHRGFLVVDRWAGYSWHGYRQLCWSHLLRDLQGFVDRGGRGGVIGAKILVEAAGMFTLWHRVRDKTLEQRTFIRRMDKIERRIIRLLREAMSRAEPKTAGMAREILALRDHLFVFVYNDGVPPTNNAAERAIRPAVLWRKGSFGTDTAEGSRYVERILSVVTTLRQQKRNVLEYLAEACANHDAGWNAPSLLPAGA
jgi:transposase